MYEDVKQKYAELESRLNDPVLMNDQKEMVKVSKEHAELRDVVAQINAYERISTEINDNKVIIACENDAELKEMATQELSELESKQAE